jgi:hypothetical protein
MGISPDYIGPPTHSSVNILRGVISDSKHIAWWPAWETKPDVFHMNDKGKPLTLIPIL